MELGDRQLMCLSLTVYGVYQTVFSVHHKHHNAVALFSQRNSIS